jgi:hypothetical protein
MKNLLITAKFIFISILCIGQNTADSGFTNTVEEGLLDQVSVYPNPTKGDFVIDLGEYYETVTIQMTDALGKVVKNEDYSVGQYLHLNLSAPKGMYFIHIISGENIKVVRMLKE